MLQALDLSVLPVEVLGGALGRDETFRRYALQVADDPARAALHARRYTRSETGRRVLAAMLLEASQAEPRLIETQLMNMGRQRGVWLEAPLEDRDPTHALQKRYLAKLLRGATVVVRRGAGCCLQCGAYKVAATYCESHRPLEHGQAARDKDAARVILRAVAEQMGIPADGPEARRVRRRVRTRTRL